nr:undecaprenyldiphospho-muramoylpentapeptide beta-N-acetylglucosaminyltransferase [Bacteroidota bacterium]
MQQSNYKIIISGGGTGGHIFPAIAIANALKAINQRHDILFVGANGRMEMEKVPAAGFKIIGLNIAGLQRSFSLKNFLFPFKLISSLLQAKKIIKDFKPDAAVGVGGYASGPLLYMAASANVPCVIQEQNSYPGITNKMLAKKASRICVAYQGMEKYFPADKLMLSGNPVREDLLNITNKSAEAFEYFGLDKNIKTILIVGGSLGARTINQSIQQELDKLFEAGVQVIWQTGKAFYDSAVESARKYESKIKVHAFISKMDYAFSVADVIVSRAGASTISELCIVGKPCILIPSPNVAEDHQTKNAMALVNTNAALMVTDAACQNDLIAELKSLLNDINLQTQLATNIKKLALPGSANAIANEVISIIQKW